MSTSSCRLFEPLAIRDVTFKNRVMVSPMNMYSAVDGMANDFHFAHLSQYALGGAGSVCLEATKVERRGLGTIGDLGLWKDEHVAPIRRIADFARTMNCRTGVQLNHQGRKAGTQRPWEGWLPLDRSQPVEGQPHWEVVGPSAIPHLDGWPTPRELTRQEIADLVAAFGESAQRAHRAGLDYVEIHGAHGYLIHEFLSPAANRRGDEYGGSLKNRMRFALEVTEAVRHGLPEGKPLFFRVSSVDEGGWELEHSIALARELKQLGVDAIDCSSGGMNVRSSTHARPGREPGYQVPYAAAIRREARIMTIAVGLIVDPRQAETILADGQADVIAIAREMLYDPYWTVHAAQELGIDPDFSGMPPQYGWWLDRRSKMGFRRDAVREPYPKS